MTPSEIQASYQRAQEVLNGFKQPPTRLANDIVALVEHIYAMQQCAVEPRHDDMKYFFGGIFK